MSPDTPETRLSELGMDSLEKPNALFSLEDAFKIELMRPCYGSCDRTGVIEALNLALAAAPWHVADFLLNITTFEPTFVLR